MVPSIRITSRSDIVTRFGPSAARAFFTAPIVADDEPLALTTAERADRVETLDLRGRVILLATDGSTASASATRVADALARQHGAVVHAVNVLETDTDPNPVERRRAAARADDSSSPGMLAQRIHQLTETLEAALAHHIDWPVHVMIGTPAVAIVQKADVVHAALIVIGLRRHGAMDRGVDDETTLTVVRRACCPVLAVAPGLDEIPKRAVAAVDFGRSSTAAARCASRLLAPHGTLVLAYVPPLARESSDEGERIIRELGVAAAFADTDAELERAAERTEHVVLHHKLPQAVSKLLIEYALGAKAQLIAAGSVRQDRVDRWLLGSASTALIRDGRRSVLIVPPPDGRAPRASR